MDECCQSVSAKKCPQVTNEAAMLSDKVASLHSVITRLDDRLQSIVSPTEGPLEDTECKPQESLVDLAQNIRSESDRVQSAINRIETIIQHLEL